MGRSLAPVLALKLAALMSLLSVWAWFVLPPDARIPVHWGSDLSPDGFLGKSVGLLTLPAAASVLAFLVLQLKRGGSKGLQSWDATGLFGTAALASICCFAAIHSLAVLSVLVG